MDGSTGRLPALDGVRALAVLAVILFHGGIGWLPGGFLGVDVFFVLSGFLITSLLLAERQASGTLDLGRFWARRMRRLLPALFVVVITVAVVVARRPDAAVAASFRGDALAALGYVANWRFAFAGGDYFAQSAALPALQHTWSLAVEEQFYVVWPLVLLLVLRRARSPRRRVAAVAGVGAAASVALMTWLFVPGHDPSRVYYGTDTRGQSLLVGAVLAALLAGTSGAPRRLRAAEAGALGVGGLAVLTWACVRLDGGTGGLYRGGFVVVAVAGAALIAGLVLAPSGPLARALGLPPLRGLGRISYGVYLWHWPVQLALTGARTSLTGSALLLVRLVVTILLATASWWLVERPVQLRVRPSVRTAPGFLAAGVAVAAVVALSARPLAVPALPAISTAASDVPAVPPPQIATVSAGMLPLPPTHRVDAAGVAVPVPARSAPARTVGVALLGDSVAQSLATGLGPVAAAYSVRVTDDAIIGCGIAVADLFRLRGQVRVAADACAGWEGVWAARLAEDRPQVGAILLGRHEVWDAFFQGRWTHIGDPAYDAYLRGRLRRAIDVVAGSGARAVLLTAPYFRQPEGPDGNGWPENAVARVDAWNRLLRSVAGPRVTVVELGRLASAGGPQVQRDGVHFGTAGARWLAPVLLPQLRAAAAG